MFGASAEAIAAKTRAKTALIPTEKTELNVLTRLAFAPEKGGGGEFLPWWGGDGGGPEGGQIGVGNAGAGALAVFHNA